MKRIWILAIIAVMVFAACGGNGADSDDPPANIVNGQDENGNAAADTTENGNGTADTTENGNAATDITENGNGNADTTENGNATENANATENDPADTTGPEPAPVVVPPRAGDVVYSLSTDSDFQNMPVGTRGTSDDVLTTPYIVGAGTPVFSVAENPLGGVALRITHRDQTWHAVDVVTSEIGMDTSANSYIITVRGNIEVGGNVTVGGGDSPYATIFSQASPSGDFTLTGTITAATLERAGERGHLRVGSDNRADLVIHEIEISRIELIPPIAIPERPATMLWSLATDGYLQNRAPGDSGAGNTLFGGTAYLQTDGTPLFTVVENPHGAGVAILVTERSDDWHTIDVVVGNMEGFDPAANTYTVRVVGRIVAPPEGATADIMGTGSPWGRFAAVDVAGDGTFTVVADNINAETMDENGATNRIRIAASNAAGESDFYVYELEVTRN